MPLYISSRSLPPQLTSSPLTASNGTLDAVCAHRAAQLLLRLLLTLRTHLCSKLVQIHRIGILFILFDYVLGCGIVNSQYLCRILNSLPLIKHHNQLIPSLLLHRVVPSLLPLNRHGITQTRGASLLHQVIQLIVHIKLSSLIVILSLRASLSTVGIKVILTHVVALTYLLLSLFQFGLFLQFAPVELC